MSQKKSKKVLKSTGTKSGQWIVDREESRGEESNKASSKAEDDKIAAIKETREAYLVVATLIATVTLQLVLPCLVALKVMKMTRNKAMQF